MTTHHISLDDDETNPAPTMVLKKELFTTEQTEYGVRVTKLKRQFSGNGSMDSCAAGELCAKWIACDPLPSYATNFSVKRYDNLQLMQKLRAANKGILLDYAR